MAKLELDHSEVRMIMDREPEIFKEVRDKVMRSALKNYSIVKMDEAVDKLIQDEAQRIITEYGYTYNWSKRSVEPTSNLRKAIENHLTETFKKSCQQEISKAYEESREEIKHIVDNYITNLKYTIQKYIDIVVKVETAQYIDEQVARKIKEVVAGLGK